MSGIVVTPLAFRESTSGDPVREARIYDALKRNITLIALDPSTPPGIYMQNGRLVEVVYPEIKTEVHPSTLVADQNVHFFNTCDRQMGPLYERPAFGSQEIMSFSATVPSAIATSASHLRASKTAEVRFLDTGEVQRGGCPFAFLMSMSFADIINGQLDWMTLPGTNVRVDYFMFIDTGGQLTTWVYSATTGIYTIHEHGTLPLTHGEWMTYKDFKCKIRNLSQDPRRLPIFYSSGKLRVDFQPLTTAMMSISDLQKDYSITVPAFTMGAAVGFSPNVLNYPFDGIAGLGRSHPGQNPLGTPGLVQHLLNTRRILRPIFFVCLRYVPVPPHGYGFVSFGGWPDDFQPAPAFTEIALSAEAAPGKWAVKLQSINLIVPGRDTEIIWINKVVILDTGTSESVLPDEPTKAIRDHFLHRESQFMIVPRDAEVELVFESTARPGAPSIERAVKGSAVQFLLTPPLAPIGAPVYQHYTIAPSQAPDTEWVLGVNLFRTFVVGFDDSPDTPKIMMAKQL